MRNLGRTGVKVSPLCLGCMTFGGRTGEAGAMDMVDRAIDAGVNFIDTADAYGRGGSETILGKALRRNGQRGRIILATKVHALMNKEDPNTGGIQRRHILKGCEDSLNRLQTDTIDLYQMHRPNPDIPVDESLRAMDDLVRSGKVRYVGSSTFPAWRLVESFWVSRELGLERIVCEQPPYNLLDRRVERELIPMALTYGLAVIPWSPLAGGFLTGKYDRDNPDAAEGRLSQGRRGEKHFSEPAFKVVDALGGLARRKDCTPSQLALAWCASQGGVTSAIIGPRTMEQLEDNLAAFEVTVTDEDRARLDEVAPPGGAVVGYYESGTWRPNRYGWL